MDYLNPGMFWTGANIKDHLVWTKYAHRHLNFFLSFPEDACVNFRKRG